MSAVPEQKSPDSGMTLIVGDVRAPAGLSGTKILFTDDGVTRGAYQLARWFEPLPIYIQREVVAGIRNAGGWRSVARGGALIAGDRVLSLEINDAVHQVGKENSTVYLRVSAELLDVRRSIVTRNKIFEITTPARSIDAEGAVDAFAATLSDFRTQLVDWINQGESSAS